MIKISGPLPPFIPSLQFQFSQTSPLSYFSFFPLKLIHLCLVKSLMKPDTPMATNLTINPNGHSQN